MRYNDLFAGNRSIRRIEVSKRLRYEKPNERDRQKNSEGAGSESKRTYIVSKKKQNPLVIGALVGGVILFLIILIYAASRPSEGDTGASREAPTINIQEEENNYKKLWDSGSTDQAEADRLRDDDQIAADEYYTRAIDKLGKALAIVKRLTELYPGTKYPGDEEQIEHQLADINKKAGFNVGR
jgi:hypothetical protein